MIKRSVHFFNRVILLIFFLFFPLNFAHAQVPITVLGNLGGSYGVARGINDNGQVVGGGSLYDETVAGFLWDNGVMTNLTYDAAGPWDINNAGYIAGQNNGYGGFIWHNGKITTLDGNLLGGNYVALLDINSTNQVMGIGNNDKSEYHAFIWRDGNIIDLGAAEGLSGVKGAINDNGQVIAGHILFDNGQKTDIGMSGFDINNHKKIVGASHNIWDNGTIINMALDNTSFNIVTGLAINDKDQVVGGGLTNGDEWRGFLWDEGKTTVLGTLGGDYGYAYDINNYGQIVGYTTDVNGKYHPTMWTLPPSVNIKINDSDETVTIPYNSSATISWNSKNTKTCHVMPLDLTGTSGSQLLTNLTASQTFTLTCTGPGGTATDSATINIDTVPKSKEDCKNDGWKNFNGRFKNKGECIKYTNSR